jgi:hypothetical protein
MAPRAGEKRHEVLISGDESVRTYYIKAGGYFVLTGPGYDGVHGGQQLSLGVELNSADAPRLTVADLHAMLS